MKTYLTNNAFLTLCQTHEKIKIEAKQIIFKWKMETNL